jgi:hypothetical protein
VTRLLIQVNYRVRITYKDVFLVRNFIFACQQVKRDGKKKRGEIRDMEEGKTHRMGMGQIAGFSKSTHLALAQAIEFSSTGFLDGSGPGPSNWVFFFFLLSKPNNLCIYMASKLGMVS